MTDEEIKEESSISDQLGKGILAGLAILIVMALVSPWIYGRPGSLLPGDYYGFFRTIFETAGPIFIKTTLGLIILHRLEYGLVGNWIQRIFNVPYGPLGLFAIFLYCVLR